MLFLDQGLCKIIFLCSVLHWRIIRIKRFFSGVHAYVYVPMHSHTLNKRPFIQFMSESAPCTHAWTPEKNRLILLVFQSNTEHKNIFLHIPGLKITQMKIPWNVVDDVGTLTTWRHMKTSSLKRKNQTSLGLVHASILIKFN